MTTVNIVKLGSSPVSVVLENWGTALDALVEGGFNVDSITDVKRNGSIISLDTQVDDWDMLLISTEKIKWGTEEVKEKDVYFASFDLQEANKEINVNDWKIAFSEGSLLQDLVKCELHKKNVSMSRFAWIIDSEWEKVSLWDVALNWESYKIFYKGISERIEEDY